MEVSRIILMKNHSLHTFLDIKPDNVLFVDGTSPKAIKKYLDGPVVGDFQSYGMRHPSVLPIPTHFNGNDPPELVVLYFVQLVDFGNGHPILSSFNSRLT